MNTQSLETEGKTRFYITAAIDYTNGQPHIGHVYEKVLADALVRYHKLAGFDTFFSTGTDEHGEKIYKAAGKAGISPQAFVDQLSVESFQKLYRHLDINYDDFVRTTEARHKSYVESILTRAYEKGDIYYAEYEGLYSVGSERFVTEKELIEGPNGQKVYPGDKDPPELRKEANYFLKLEKYRLELLEFLETHPDYIQPTPYRNEVLEMLREPTHDLSISRPSARMPWGIPIPWDPTHVTYVWFDALLAYYSGPHSQNRDDLLPLTWHVIGKDILKPHAIYWPIIQRAAGLPHHQKLVVHAHILAEDGRKMGKSLGNAVDPLKLIETYGVDPVRYSLLRETTMGADSPYGEGILRNRLENDLANDLGNLLSRTISMVNKYRAGRVPQSGELGEREKGIEARARALPSEVFGLARQLRINAALEAAMEFVRDLNRYIAESQPWALAKRPEDAKKLDTVLYTVLEGLRVASVLLEPALPNKARELRAQLGLEGKIYPLKEAWGLTPPGIQVIGGAILFPKPQDDKEVLMESTEHKTEQKIEQKQEVVQATPTTPEITIDDFAKIDLRIAEIIAAETIEKADKLLKLTVKLGEEERTVVSGIRNWFTPADLVGRKVVLVTNLKPVKLRGILSQGMVLAAEDAEGNLDLVGTKLDLPSNTKVR